jgi:NAD+ synthase
MTVTTAVMDGLCAWLRDQLGDRKAVVGISGGVDSSVVAALCVRSVGASRVVAVRLPCGDAGDDVHYQTMLVDHLGVISRKVDLTGSFWKMCEELALDPGWEQNRLRCGNIKARLRMTALYDFAAAERGLVVGTTNRSEYEIGYATKYGDHGVDLEPLQDFLKGEVLALGWLLGLPEPLVIRVPTAGLWEGQTDEGEIGMSYDDLDRILAAWEREVIVTKPGDVARVQKWKAAAEHKKRVPPHYKRPAA